MIGVVVKGLGGLFEVLTENGRIACRARGTLKRDEEKVLIGDRVELDRPDGEYVIARVDPRRNALIRPPIANLDALYDVLTEGGEVRTLVFRNAADFWHRFPDFTPRLVQMLLNARDETEGLDIIFHP